MAGSATGNSEALRKPTARTSDLLFSTVGDLKARRTNPPQILSRQNGVEDVALGQLGPLLNWDNAGGNALRKSANAITLKQWFTLTFTWQRVKCAPLLR